MSGYVHCGCRDCMEIAIGTAGEALCCLCEEAGCEAGAGECAREDEDAYGGGEPLATDPAACAECWNGLGPAPCHACGRTDPAACFCPPPPSAYGEQDAGTRAPSRLLDLDDRGYLVPLEIGFRDEGDGNGVQWAVYRRSDVQMVLIGEGLAWTADGAAEALTGWKSVQRGAGRRFSHEPMLRVGRTRVLAKQRTGVDV